MSELNSARAHPQDPYASLIVSASAGSGKTHQLSHRFLSLVSAGASPGKILTVTFTRKASNEMRERILNDATKLLHDCEFQSEFEKKMEVFYRNALSAAQRRSPPLSPIKTAEAILASTQQLRISTMDSLFFEWVKRFQFEALGSNANRLIDRIQLIDTLESSKLNDQTWNATAAALELINIPELQESFKKYLRANGFTALRQRIEPLFGHDHYIWLCAQNGGAHLALHQLPFAKLTDSDHARIRERCRQMFLSLAPHLSDKFRELVGSKINQNMSVHEWRECGVLSAKWEISGTFLRGKKREEWAATIDRFSEEVREYLAHQMLENLSRTGTEILDFYNAYQAVRNDLMMKKGWIDFGSLTRAVYSLFHDEGSAGVRMLIARECEHLLLDEFQDTSPVQWEIFSKLIMELVSGEGLHAGMRLAPTVFIVGDPKQSIYGFREADYTLMERVSKHIQKWGAQEISLDENYRSAPFILNFVNHVFDDRLHGFRTHFAAAKADGIPRVKDLGAIWVSETFIDDVELDRKANEREAEFVARQLGFVLANPEKFPVFDKNIGECRPIKAGDCAVLFRNATQAGIFEAALRRQGLPVLLDRADNVMHRQELRDLFSLLCFVAFPHDLASFLGWVQSPMVMVSNELLVDHLFASKNHSVDVRIDSLIQMLQKQNPRFENWLSAIQKARDSTYSPVEFLMRIDDLVMDAYRKNYPESEFRQARANIEFFFDLCDQIQNEVGALFAPLCQRLLEYTETTVYVNAAATTDAITLMTIHKSKGLEFPLVALVDVQSNWEKLDRYWLRRYDTKAAVGQLCYVGTQSERNIDHPLLEKMQNDILAALKDESDRILYVALTRSRHYLLISGSQSRVDQEGTESERLLDLLTQKLKAAFSHTEFIEKDWGSCHYAEVIM